MQSYQLFVGVDGAATTATAIYARITFGWVAQLDAARRLRGSTAHLATRSAAVVVRQRAERGLGFPCHIGVGRAKPALIYLYDTV